MRKLSKEKMSKLSKEKLRKQRKSLGYEEGGSHEKRNRRNRKIKEIKIRRETSVWRQ